MWRLRWALATLEIWAFLGPGWRVKPVLRQKDNGGWRMVAGRIDYHGPRRGRTDQ